MQEFFVLLRSLEKPVEEEQGVGARESRGRAGEGEAGRAGMERGAPEGPSAIA
jgi:hypothetical protein